MYGYKKTKIYPKIQNFINYATKFIKFISKLFNLYWLNFYWLIVVGELMTDFYKSLI